MRFGSSASAAAALGAALVCVAVLSGCSPLPRPEPTVRAASRCDGATAKVTWGHAKPGAPAAVRVLVSDPVTGTSESGSIPLQASAKVTFQPGSGHQAPESENNARWGGELIDSLRRTGIVPKDFGTALSPADTTSSVSSVDQVKTMVVEEVSTVSVSYRVTCPGNGAFSGSVSGPVSNGTLFTDTVLCDAQPAPGNAPDVAVAIGLISQFCANT